MKKFLNIRLWQSSVALLLVLIAIVFYFAAKEKHFVINLPDCAKIAVIDAAKLKNSAKCFKAHEEVAEMLNKVISKMKNSENEIKAEYDKINRNNSLSDKQKKFQIRKIENKWAEISNQYNSEIQNIRNTDLKLSEYLESEIGKVIETVSQSLNINLVLNKEMKDAIIVFYNTNNMDITDIVINKINKKLPTSKLREILHD